MRRWPILIGDGETIVLIAKTQGPTVFDPCDATPYVSQAYRVVADRTGPTLQLVPLRSEPVRLSQNEAESLATRVIDTPRLIEEFSEMSGWKFDAPIISKGDKTKGISDES